MEKQRRKLPRYILEPELIFKPVWFTVADEQEYSLNLYPDELEDFD